MQRGGRLSFVLSKKFGPSSRCWSNRFLLSLLNTPIFDANIKEDNFSAFQKFFFAIEALVSGTFCSLPFKLLTLLGSLFLFSFFFSDFLFEELFVMFSKSPRNSRVASESPAVPPSSVVSPRSSNPRDIASRIIREQVVSPRASRDQQVSPRTSRQGR